MGLLSDYATGSGLFDTPQVAQPNPQLAALIAALAQGSQGAAATPYGQQPPQLPIQQPQQAQSQMPPVQPGAPQHHGLLGGLENAVGGLFGGSQNAAPAPPGGLLAPQDQSVMGTIGRGLGNVIKLPFNIVNGYAASAADVPQRIAFEQAQRAYALKAAQQGQALIGGLLGPGGGGLFGDSGGGSAAPMVAAPDMSNPGALAAPMLPGGAGKAPTPVGPVSLPQAGPQGVSGAPMLPPGGDGLPPPPAPDYGAPLLSAARNPDQVGPYAKRDQIIPGAGRPGLNLRDPRTQRIIGALDLLGNPAGAALTQLGTAVMPKYSDARPGSMARDEATGQLVGSSVPQDGTYNIPLTDGSFRNVEVGGAANNAAAYSGAVAGGKAAGEAIGGLPFVAPRAQAQAGGEGAGAAPYATETHDINGVPTTHSRAWWLQNTGGAAGGGAGSPGGTGTGVGVGFSPPQSAFLTDQAKALSDTVNADQSARTGAMATRDQAARAITLATQTPFNPAAPARYQAEKIASVFGIPSKDMDNIATYQQLATSSILSYAKGNLPTRFTERELALVKPVIGGIKDPNSAALMAAGLQAATAGKVIARARYADSYNPASGLTKQQYEAGWANTPDGKASLFQDPIWRGITIGGKPAVAPFMIKGQPWLAITPGLGKPTFVRAY